MLLNLLNKLLYKQCIQVPKTYQQTTHKTTLIVDAKTYIEMYEKNKDSVKNAQFVYPTIGGNPWVTIMIPVTNDVFDLSIEP